MQSVASVADAPFLLLLFLHIFPPFLLSENLQLSTWWWKNNDDAGYTLYNVLQQQSQAASQADEAGAAVVDASNGAASADAGGDVDAPTALCVYIM